MEAKSDPAAWTAKRGKVKVGNALPPIPYDITGSSWTIDQRIEFVKEYNRMARSPGIMQLFAIVFPIQHFLLGRWGMGIVFMFTMPFAVIAGLAAGAAEEDSGTGGYLGALLMLAGIVWYIVEWFLTQRRVRDYNQALAEGLYHQFNENITTPES